MVGQFIDVKGAEHGDRHVLSRRDFEADRKTALHLSGRFCEGELCQEHECVHEDGATMYCFELNRRRFGWSYKWVSNKHRAADKHVFVVSAYATPHPDWQQANLLVSMSHSFLTSLFSFCLYTTCRRRLTRPLSLCAQHVADTPPSLNPAPRARSWTDRRMRALVMDRPSS